MKPQVPSRQMDQHIQNISLTKVLNGNVEFSNPAELDTNNVPTTFTQANTSGNMFRIGPAGSGISLVWPASNTNLTFQHNLGRLPIGFFITYKNKTVDVFQGTVAWTTANITLQATDGSADTIVYIF